MTGIPRYTCFGIPKYTIILKTKKMMKKIEITRDIELIAKSYTEQREYNNRRYGL